MRRDETLESSSALLFARVRSSLCALVLLSSCAHTATSHSGLGVEEIDEGANDWNACLAVLSGELAQRAPAAESTRLAVMDFRDLRGREVPVGPRMRDALSERLFATGVFDTMVERAALDRALAEIRLQRTVSTAGSSEFDQSTVISAAHLQGANIVILGTAEVVGDQCHFTARMIRVDDATILAIASADTALTDEHVARGCSDESSPTAVGTGASVTTTPAPVAPLYDESLSGVREGQLPAAWIGAANLMMRLENGRRAVAFFQGDRDSFTVPDITWPDNYRLRIRVHLPNREPELVVTIGSVRCRLSGGPFDGQNGIRINETVAPTADLRGTEVLFEIVRQGDVVRALANGVGGPLVRVPSDPDARGMTVTLGAWNEAGATVSEWRLYSISVEAVPPAR